MRKAIKSITKKALLLLTIICTLFIIIPPTFILDKIFYQYEYTGGWGLELFNRVFYYYEILALIIMTSLIAYILLCFFETYRIVLQREKSD